MDIHRDEQGKLWLYSDKLGQSVIMRADNYDCAIYQMLSTLEFFHDLLQTERAKIYQIEQLSEKLQMLLNTDC